MLEICYDDKKLKNLQRALAEVPRALPKVMSRGLNRTASSARTQVGRSLSKRVGLRVKDVRQRVILKKASYNKWRSAISISDKKIPLMSLKARQTRRGVTYRDIATRKRVLVRHAFIATMPSGHTGVFRRETSQRLPIKELMGPSLFNVFVNAQEEAQRIYNESMQRLEKNIDDQVKLILSKRIPA